MGVESRKWYVYTSSSEFVRSRWILINATMQGKREEGEEEQEGKWIYSWRFSGKGRERLCCAIEQRGFSFFFFFSFFSLGENRWRRVAKNRKNPLYFFPQITLFFLLR